MRGDGGPLSSCIQVLANLLRGVNPVVQVRDEGGNRPLEVDVVLPQRIVGVEQQRLPRARAAGESGTEKETVVATPSIVVRSASPPVLDFVKTRALMIIPYAQNFTLRDLVGTARAAVAFAAILFCPGYLTGVATDLLSFRHRTLLARAAWAIALSFAVVPVYIALAGRVLPLGGVATTLALGAAATLIALVADRRRIRLPRDRHTLLLAAFLLLAAIVVVAELVDIQRGRGLLLSVTVLDQSYRVAFTDALARTGIPPANPLYHPGTAAPLRYYYFWYALCATCMRLAGTTARQALIASSLWSGLGLVAVTALFARHFLQLRARLRRFILIAALLLTVTGLDILPTLFNLVVSHIFDGDLEWWSTDQISSWFDTVLWVPNHLAAMICCVTAFLLLWPPTQQPDAQPTRKQRIAATLLAGAAAAGALGLSVYVAAGFAMLMLAYVLWQGLRSRNSAFVVRVARAALYALLLSLPYLREMTHTQSGTQAGSAAGPLHMFQFSVRQMIDPTLITQLSALAGLQHAHPLLLDQAVRLLLLLPGYALEFGFFAAVLILALLRRTRLDAPRRTLLFLAVSGLVLVGFLRSAVIQNNDFGYRAALFPCFFLLLLGADLLTHQPRPDQPSRTPNSTLAAQSRTILLTTLLLLGLAGTIFQAAALRLYVPLHTAARMPGFATLPGDAFAARTAYEAANLPPDAIVQANPDSQSRYAYLVNMLYSQRPSATDAAIDCGAVFGGDPTACPALRKALTTLFASPAPTPAQARETCRQYGIEYLAATQADPAWSIPNGWVWTLPLRTGDRQPSTPLGFRILQCNAPSP